MDRFSESQNTLTHEYPDNEDEIIEAIKLAVVVYNKMITIYSEMINYVQRK